MAPIDHIPVFESVRLRFASEAGFTLIECLVASVVLLVGLLGTFAMIDGAQGAQSASRSREGATNLSREFLEAVRGDAYTAVTSSVLTSTLQAMSGYQSMSGSAAVINRRNINYSVTSSVCSIDDPKDGLGTTDSTFCSQSTPTSPADNQPDDLKRVTVTVTWSGRRSSTVTAAAMLSSTGAVIGLPLQAFTMDSPTNIGASATAPIITSSSTTVAPCAANTACFTANSTGATKIVFAVDGADQSGTPVTMDATCAGLPCPKWHLAWNYSTLTDGVYRITARSIDSGGIEGAPRSILVTISRGGTSKPCGVGSTPGTCLAVEGGYNYLPGGGTTPIFELRWQANPERNVVGYKVQTGAGAAGTGTVVCTLDAQGNVISPSAQSRANAAGIDPYACIDTSPPAPSTTAATYGVYAQYSNGSTGTVVDGPVATVSAAGVPGPVTTYSTVAKTFGINATTSASGCTSAMTSPGPWPNSPNATNSTPLTFCTPAMSTLFPTATSVQLQSSVTVRAKGYENHSNSGKDCTFSWDLRQGSGGASVFPGGTTLSTVLLQGGNPVQTLTQTVTLASPVTVASGTSLALRLAVATPGSGCGWAEIHYGDSPEPGSIDVSFRVGTITTPTSWLRPNPPTAVTKAASGSNTTVSWTGSSGGNVAFYRIYRDGQAYANRYDTCDVGDLTSAGGCDNNNGTFTYADQNTGGTTHTYWVTAVYGTGTPVAATMAESAEVAAP